MLWNTLCGRTIIRAIGVSTPTDILFIGALEPKSQYINVTINQICNVVSKSFTIYEECVDEGKSTPPGGLMNGPLAPSRAWAWAL